MTKKALILAAAALATAAGAASAGIVITPSAVGFVDISTTGTAVIPPGAYGDDVEHPITAAALSAAGFSGNELLAGGVGLTVGNNGAVIWNPVVAAAGTSSTGDQVGYYNAGPNNSRTPAGSYTSIGGMAAANGASDGNGNGVRQFIAPLWDDYNSPVTGTSVKWQVIAGDLYLQWSNEDHFAAAGTGTVTFQMVVRGGVTIASGSSLVDFVYQDTSYVAAGAYQNDGGSATIGYKNWGVVAAANDVEYGIGGGGTSATSDPAFNGLGQQPKVAGYIESGNPNLPHSLSIIPAPGTLALLGFGALIAGRRRRA